MTTFVLATALLNLALGFYLAVYFGAAPRFSDSHNPLFRHAHREPLTAWGRRLLDSLPPPLSPRCLRPIPPAPR